MSTPIMDPFEAIKARINAAGNAMWPVETIDDAARLLLAAGAYGPKYRMPAALSIAPSGW